MEPNDAIITFDTIYATTETQLLKLALPLVSPSLRPYIALLIKTMEMKHCFNTISSGLCTEIPDSAEYYHQFFESAMPYCTESQKELIFQFKKIKQMMEQMERLKPIMDCFDFSGDTDFDSVLKAFSPKQNSSELNPEDFMQSYMSDEQSDMFRKFQEKINNEFNL